MAILEAAVAVVIGLIIYKWMAKPADSEPLVSIEELAQLGPHECLELIFEGTGGTSKGPVQEESTAELSDFAPFSERKTLDILPLLRDEKVHVYTYDRVAHAIVLVEAKVDNDNAAFFYQQQRRNAQRVFVIGADQFAAAVQKVVGTSLQDRMDRVILLHSTGRCGSTLLSKCMDHSNGVRSLSEPDAYSQLTFAWRDGEISSSETKAWSAAVTTHLAFHYLRHDQHDGGSDFLAIKFRAFVVLIADLLAQGSPAAKQVFLYREALATLDSFLMAFSNNAVVKFMRTWGLDAYLVQLTWMAPFLRSVAPLLEEERFNKSTIHALGIVGFQFMMWLSSMDEAWKLAQRGFWHATLRYEELLAHKEAMIQAMMLALYPDSDFQLQAGELAHVFGKDAHGDGKATSSSRNDFASSGATTGKEAKPLQFIQDSDRPGLDELLKAHTELAACDYILPGTLLVADQ